MRQPLQAPHAQRMTSKTTEFIEVVAAAVVTAGLVLGNLALFAPLRTDNRSNPSEPRTEAATGAQPSREEAARSIPKVP